MPSTDLDSPQDSTALHRSKSTKRHSWFGSAIKQLINQTTSIVKPSLDTIGERHDSITSECDYDACPANGGRLAKVNERPVLRHRRTLSARSAFASIRSHLPKRSLDHKRRSLADLLSGESDERADLAGPECFYTSPSRHQLASLAKPSPAPHSPIDIYDSAPALDLDLGTPNFECTIQGLDEAYAKSSGAIPVGKPVTPSKLLDVFDNQLHISPSDALLPDPLQPVAEARIFTVGGSRLSNEVSRDARDTISFSSPLPGTTLQMDFETAHPDIAEQIPSLSDQPTIAEASAMPDSPMLAPLERITARISTPEGDKAIVDTIAHAKEHRNVTPVKLSQHRASIENTTPSSHGLPSPDRVLSLPIRSKPTSMESGRTSIKTSSSRKLRTSQESDLTVALLRERTSDDYAFVLDKLVISDSPSSLGKASITATQYSTTSPLAIILTKSVENTNSSPASAMLSRATMRRVSSLYAAEADSPPSTKTGAPLRNCDVQNNLSSSSPTSLQRLVSQKPFRSSLTAVSSSPWSTKHNQLTLLDYPDDSDDEEGEDLPDCFNIGVTYT